MRVGYADNLPAFMGIKDKVQQLGFLPPLYQFPIRVGTCRYIRTPVFKIYPDDLWTFHMVYNGLEEGYYFQNNTCYEDKLTRGEDEIIEGFINNISSYLKSIKDMTKAIALKEVEDSKNRKGKEIAINGADKAISWGAEQIQTFIKEYLKGEASKNKTGFMLQYDGEGKEIVYNEEYKEVFQYMNLALMLVSFILEILLLYFSGGASSLKKVSGLGKLIKKKIKKREFSPADFNEIKEKYTEFKDSLENIGAGSKKVEMFKQWEKVKGEGGLDDYWKESAKTLDFVFDIVLPKIGLNYGTYYEKQENGAVNRIHEFAIKANPLLAVNVSAALNTEDIWKIVQNVKRFLKGLDSKTYEEPDEKTLGASLELGFVAIGSVLAEAKVRLNSDTKKFSLKSHENQKNTTLTEDKLVVKNGSRIVVDIYGKGEVHAKVKLGRTIDFTLAEASVSAKLSGSMGMNDIYGYDNEGPYLQKEFYFSGLKGTFEAEGKLLNRKVGEFSSEKQKVENGKVKDKTEKELEEQMLEPYVFQTPKFHPFSLIK